jgi:hypothetical protein
MFYSFVFVYPEPRRANQNPRLSTLLALSFEGGLEGFVSLQFASPVVLSAGHCPLTCPYPGGSLPIILLSYLESTLMKAPVSVASKELTGSLNPLDATLMKNRAWGSYC